MTKVKGKETGKKTVSQNTDKPSKYINPLTDFGFKYLFGVKELLIDFLNGILDIESGIVDLTYDNTERIPHSDEERIARFDLHCTTGKGEHVIIEMQNASQDFFKDRTVYYATFPIQEQAPKGDKNWIFKLQPVYSVNIVNFRIKDIKPDGTKKAKITEPDGKYITNVQLIDRDTGEVFYKKLTFVYLELPLFTKKENELKTSIEQWTFVLKHLPDLIEVPEVLQNDVFEKLFQIAEIAKLPAKNRKEYNRSLKNYRDMMNSITQRDQKIAQRDHIIAQRDQKIAQRDHIIAQRDQKIAQRDQKIAHITQDNKAKDKIIADLQRQLRFLDKNAN